MDIDDLKPLERHQALVAEIARLRQQLAQSERRAIALAVQVACDQQRADAERRRVPAATAAGIPPPDPTADRTRERQAAGPGGDGHPQGFAEAAAGAPLYWDVQAMRDTQPRDRPMPGSSGDCLTVIDLDGRIEFVGRTGGVSIPVPGRNDVIGRSWLRQWHGADHEAADAALARAREGGTGRFQGYCAIDDGIARWWDMAVSPLPVEDGGVGRLVAIGRDITERRQAEQLLAVGEERLRLALEATGLVGIWDWDLQSDLVTADATLAGIYTVDPAWAARGAPLAEYVRHLHPDDMAGFRTELDRVLAGAAPFASEYRLLQADGSVRWVLARGAIMRDTRGAPVRFLGASVDMTERKQAEIRQAFLLELSDRLRALTHPQAIMAGAAAVLGRHLAAAQVGHGLVQPDDVTILLEPGYVDGVEPLAGRYPLEVFGADAVARQRQGLAIVFDDILSAPSCDPTAWDATARAVVSVPLLRDGRFRASLYVIHTRPHAWSTQELTLIEDVAARTWDAVERAQAEAASRDANEMLERRVIAALAEQEKVEETLRQAQKMEAVGQLTGGLAHDFNNLLTGITGSLELLEARLAQGRTADLGRYVDAALGASRRAAALTHRLLAFSRGQTLDPRPTDVNRLVAGMEDFIRRTAGPMVEIEVIGADGLWPALVDPNQLENALLNLCINARDAMPSGGLISIETANVWLDQQTAEQGLPPGQYLSLSVTDTGTGMTSEVMARAFEPFFTTKAPGQGTGLGLSMIYGFARQSGGQVRVHSAPDHGTTICLYLPRHLGAAGAGDAVVGPAATARSGEGGAVLIVDDEPVVRMLVAEVLTDLGHHAVEAADGAAGLEVLRSGARIDLLITDVGLPGGMNGRQLAEAARDLQPDLKVLFITGYGESAALGEGHVDPDVRVLTKPFPLETLIGCIRELIEAG